MTDERREKSAHSGIGFKAVLRARSEALTASLREARQLLGSHAPSSGSAQERAVAEFLRAFLPSRFKVDSGFVVNAAGDVSGQQDVLILGEKSTGPIANYAGFGVHPVENVVAVVEVKTRLTTARLRSAFETVHSVSRLAPDVAGESTISDRPGNRLVSDLPVCPPFTAIFAFESDVPPSSARGMFDQWHQTHVTKRDRLNCVMVLDEWFMTWIQRQHDRPPELIVNPQAYTPRGHVGDPRYAQWEERSMEIGLERLDSDTLRPLMAMLLSFLSWYRQPRVNLQDYLLQGLPPMHFSED